MRSSENRYNGSYEDRIEQAGVIRTDSWIRRFGNRVLEFLTGPRG